MFTKSDVFDAIKLTKEMLNDEVPLIGFAGSALTIIYAVEGQSKSFDKASDFVFYPEAAHIFYYKKITDTYFILKRKVKSGVNAVQFFDSWGGMLFQLTIKNHGNTSTKSLKNLADDAPVIVF
jgi:uroporphyrinogen decarboxylase